MMDYESEGEKSQSEINKTLDSSLHAPLQQ